MTGKSQMYRVKMSGHISPFCYTKKDAIKRAEKIRGWVDGRLKIELIPVDEYDPITVWKSNHPAYDGPREVQFQIFRKMEESWRTHTSKEKKHSQTEEK